ncbi:unnamed protein product [Paramecium sonneborni]|uniref:WD domain, G-beta repeat protein n=1 Tax=Paramecium sonneborni TaxID=65129 RepID=A0A8S1RRT2_9CILI|nr:unnamed protein product [Paramecium sonneborni]
MQMRCTQADHRNQQIIGFCIHSTCQMQRPYCNFCLPSHSQHLNKLTSQELILDWMKQKILIVQNVQQNVQECLIAFDNLSNLILPHCNFNIQQFPELGISEIDQVIKGLCQMEDCENKLFKKLEQQIGRIKTIVFEILKKTKNQTNIKQNDYLQILKNIEQPTQQFIQKKNLNSFTFELIKENSIKQNQWCCAIAFNRDQSIVVAGCENDIKVFQNIQGKLNQIQFLREHTQLVQSLNFMKNTNNFVSGSMDFSIIIWQAIRNNQWKCQQKLNGHQDQIFCLLLNNTDDLIISGSLDYTIKFWMKQDQWLCQQTITDHTNRVFSLSLNEQQNQLISTSEDQQILIIEQQKQNKQWFVTQKIIVNQFGLNYVLQRIINLHSNLIVKKQCMFIRWIQILNNIQGLRKLLQRVVHISMFVYLDNNTYSKNASF